MERASCMNRRFLSVLMFAFVVAGGASIVLYKLVIGRMSTNAPAATSSILVAAKNLALGSVIGDADLRIAAWPGTIPEGSIVKLADAVGRGVAAPIYANEPITESRLGTKGAGGGLAATIPPGMRAVAIRVNEIVGVAGFAVPGTHVDVLVSGNSRDVAGGNSTQTLLQNISVLSAGQDFKKDTEGKPVTVQVVNLLVTPQQAEMLSLASNQMTLQLVLRNPLDTVVTAIPGITLSSILSGEVQPVVRSLPVSRSLAVKAAPTAVVAVRAPPPELPRMEIIAGSKRTETSMQRTDAR
jgi:pilus assembly protein CpaB